MSFTRFFILNFYDSYYVMLCHVMVSKFHFQFNCGILWFVVTSFWIVRKTIIESKYPNINLTKNDSLHLYRYMFEILNFIVKNIILIEGNEQLSSLPDIDSVLYFILFRCLYETSSWKVHILETIFVYKSISYSIIYTKINWMMN